MKTTEEIRALGADGIIAAAEEAGLLEFGVDRVPVVQKWKEAAAERAYQKEPVRLVAALNNADMDGALLAVLKEDPQKVFAGMAAAACAVGAEEEVLILPEWEEAYAGEIREQAAACGVEVRAEFVNCREFRGGVIHHIETMAALAEILDGTYTPGTYLAVAKGGKTGAPVKVAYGTKVAELVGEAPVKAIRIGTKLYDASGLDLEIQPETPIGNGVITVFDKKCCMIHETERILEEEWQHSCGKCTFCREGLIQLKTMTKEITMGQGKKEFTDMLTEIGEAMSFSTVCTMGQTASDITLGSLQYFASEYDAHIRKKKCPANVCTAFMNIYIDPNACQGCEECADACPKGAIEGKAGFIHMIDEFECDKCGKCVAVCENDAIIQTTGRVPKLPTRLTKVGKFKKKR